MPRTIVLNDVLDANTGNGSIKIEIFFYTLENLEEYTYLVEIPCFAF